jgi:hypothetical protein
MDPTRRSFLTKTAVGAAGTAAVLSGGIALGSSSGASEQPLSSDELSDFDQPVLVQIRDAERGEVEVLVGEREVRFTDQALVAKVLRATR